MSIAAWNRVLILQFGRNGAKVMAKGKAKIKKVMGEFARGTLHSGSKKGPKVTNPAQAKAIALSEARKRK